MTVYKPLGDNVLIRRTEPEEKSEGGLDIPESAQRWNREATVLAVGPGRVTETGHQMAPNIAPGDHVLIYMGRGQAVEHNGESCLVVRDSDIICIVKEAQQ